MLWHFYSRKNHAKAMRNILIKSNPVFWDPMTFDGIQRAWSVNTGWPQGLRYMTL